MKIGESRVQTQLPLNQEDMIQHPGTTLQPLVQDSLHLGGAPTPSSDFGRAFQNEESTLLQKPLLQASMSDESLLAALVAFFQGKRAEAQVKPADHLPSVSGGMGTDSVNSTPSSTQTNDTAHVATKSQTDPAVLAAIDNSEFSRPNQLKKWDSLVAGLPPEQQEAAEKALNRPYAAAKLALKGGKAGEQAMAYIRANPALFRAIETRAGSGDDRHLVADGIMSEKDLKVFAGTMEDRVHEASDMMNDYRKKHPEADEQSLSLVRSAAVMYANDPILHSASEKKAAGAAGQQETKYANQGDFKALADPRNNPDLSPQLADAARLWGKSGLFNTLEDMGLKGKDVARHGGDKLADKGDFAAFIQHIAPTNGGEFADFIAYTATENAAAKVDTSQLNQDVFDHPEQYSGATKGAVMIRLQKTLEYVVAGRGIRNTKETEQALNEKIAQLQKDPDVQRFLEAQVKQNEKEIINSSPELSQSVIHHMQADVLTGNSLAQSLQVKDKGSPLSATQATNALESYHDEVQLYQDMTGNQVNVADLVAARPDLAQTLRHASTDIMNGETLTQIASQKDVPVEQALNSYLTMVAFMDDALSRTSGGGIGLPKTGVIQQALQKAGVDPQKLGTINDETLKSLIKPQDDVLANGYQQGGKSNNTLLDKLKDKAIKKGAKFAAKQGAKFATRLVAQMAGRAAAAIAGEAAGTALAGTISAAAGPVGWIAGAAVSVGFGIAELVNVFKKKAKQRRERRDFDHTVSPTLKQFGIQKPS